MEVFATGLGLGESPRWHDDRLWVCDWVAGEVLSFDESGDAPRRADDERAAVLGRLAPRRAHGAHLAEGVVTADEDGALTAYGASGQGWNEIVVDPRGNTFVNEAGFDLMAGEEPTLGHRLGGPAGRDRRSRWPATSGSPTGWRSPPTAARWSSRSPTGTA